MSKNWYLLNVIAFVFSYIPNVASQKLNPAEYIEYFRNLLPPPKSEVIGQKFLIEEPHKVEIAIHSGIISLDAARLNLDRSTIDISYNGLEKEIENTDYAYVVINHPLHKGITYYPAAKNKSTNKNLTGFVYNLDSAQTTIMVNVYNYLKKAHKDA